MKKENILVVALICIAVAGVVYFTGDKPGTPQPKQVQQTTAEAPADDGINWKNYSDGVAMAENQDKHIFLYFQAQWCTYCTKLKETSFKDPAVIDLLQKHFVSISIDTDQHKDLAMKWKVRGLPTLWFLKPDTSKISNIPGYVDAKQLTKVLDYIQTRSYDKLSFSEFSEKE